MIRYYSSRVLRVVITIFITAMIIPVNSQNLPAFDKINTTAGNVEIHFIGHGSLMFVFNNLTIYVDPVRSSGNYNNLPEADLILVTHEHGDHLDYELINDLRKKGTIIISNEISAAKVSGARIMKAGERHNFKNIVIEAVAAYNIVNERAPGQPFHPLRWLARAVS